MTIGGARYHPKTLVKNTGIKNGCELSERANQNPAASDDHEVKLVQIAGLDSGSVVELGFGEFHVGRSEKLQPSFASGATPETRFTLRVNPTGEPTIGPASGSVFLDDEKLSEPTLLNNRTIRAGDAIFEGIQDHRLRDRPQRTNQHPEN